MGTGNRHTIHTGDAKERGHKHDHGQLSLTYLNRAFIIGIVINVIFVVVEFGAGLIIGSTSLMSDAGHNLSDVVSLALAMLAFRLARNKPNERYTYGHKKSTVIVSLVNAMILLFVIGFILYESIHKLIEPQPLEGGIIAWVAGVGIVVNSFTAWLFMKDRKKDLNVNGAFLHMAADALVSVGVVVSGLAIRYTGLYIIDPIIGIAIAVVIFVSTWALLRDSVRLCMDGVPRGICLTDISWDILALDPRIKGVHHIHVWPISTTENAMTAHVIIDSLDNSAELNAMIKEMLREHGIHHTTLEMELAGAAEFRDECF